MRQVRPDEVLIVHSGAEFDFLPRSYWRIHLLAEAFESLTEGISEEIHPRIEQAFESFCLSTPWGTLYHTVAPPPPRSAQFMARRLAALLRFWDALQESRYAFWFDRKYTLAELVSAIYRVTMGAWCSESAITVREHLVLTVERMSRSTQEDCMEAVLRAMSFLLAEDTGFKHREALSDPGFLREHLAALSPRDFEDISSAYPYTVSIQLADWDRALGKP